jgi:hypothetical protein
VAETMEELHLAYPKQAIDLEELRRKYHEALGAR